jgi:hypothetical protein
VLVCLGSCIRDSIGLREFEMEGLPLVQEHLSDVDTRAGIGDDAGLMLIEILSSGLAMRHPGTRTVSPAEKGKEVKCCFPPRSR